MQLVVQMLTSLQNRAAATENSEVMGKQINTPTSKHSAGLPNMSVSPEKRESGREREGKEHRTRKTEQGALAQEFSQRKQTLQLLETFRLCDKNMAWFINSFINYTFFELLGKAERVQGLCSFGHLEIEKCQCYKFL